MCLLVSWDAECQTPRRCNMCAAARFCAQVWWTPLSMAIVACHPLWLTLQKRLFCTRLSTCLDLGHFQALLIDQLWLILKPPQAVQTQLEPLLLRT